MVKAPTLSFQDLADEQLVGLLERIRPLIQPADFQLIERIIATLRLLLECLQMKNLSLRRLLKMIFGPKTETSRNLLPKDQGTAPASSSAEANGSAPPKEKEKRKGHGRNGAEDYINAQRIFVPHEKYKPGCPCPICKLGRLYDMKDPAVVIRIVTQPIFQAWIYELMRLRCALCGETFTAKAPAEAGSGKYSEEVPAMLGILCYASGFPLFRIEKLQAAFGIPLPASTQWELLWKAAQELMPVFECLMETAAQAWLFYHDDTRMKVLSLMKENAEQSAQGGKAKERTGIFTTGILAEVDGHKIALYFTGRKHAGENLEQVLEQRQEGLPVPIQMCDGLSSNNLKNAQTQQANCNTHSRRNYADLVEAFPQECRFVLENVKEVYKHDAKTKELGLSAQARLQFHQAHSQKPMDDLKQWAQEQIDQKKVEPNSGLGQAINYMLKRWEKLTLFLRLAGAPLDNNACEQILKRSITHRKNSMFYKNERGALVGDLNMSLIETCRLCGVNPLEYLPALLKHPRLVSEHPEQWLPWNFRMALAVANTS